MIHGIYINDLSDIYANVKEHYTKSKHLLKDVTHHTICSFIQPFFDLYYNVQIKNSISLDNLTDFVNSFFEEFKTKREMENDEQIQLSKQELLDDDFELKGKEDFLYLKFYFFENCLKVLYSEDVKLQKSQIFIPTAENIQKLKNITLKLINLLLATFSIQAILLNIKLFNFFLKRVVIICFNYHNYKKDIKQLLNSNKQNSNANENKKHLLNFLLTCKIISINVDHFLNLEIISEYMDQFVSLLFSSKTFVKSFLNTASENTINQTHNHLIFLFNKFIKMLKDEKYETFYKEFIKKFLSALDEDKKIKEEEYENFIFIFTQVVNEILTHPKKQIEEKVLKLLVRILQSNHPPLHKLSLEILKKIKLENLIETKFLNNFYSLFDVLDGYNSHLFKSLWKELESLIIQCEETKDVIEFRNFLFFYKTSEEYSLSNIFSIKFNYFLIIANKIKNHENTRIQKFFIKSFSNLTKESNLKNKNFEYFIYSTLIIMLNNPLFYPENESISYHAKIGLTAEKFFLNWFEMAASRNEFENNFSQYLIGIESNITFKRIFVYLFNAICIIFNKFKQTARKFKFDMNILKSLNSIIENNSRYLPIYQKHKFWTSIANIFIQSDLLETTYENIQCNSIHLNELIKLFNTFLNNLIPIKKDCLANELGFYVKLKNCDDFNEFIELFAKLFTTIFDIEKVHCDDAFSNTIKSFELQLENLLGINNNLNADSILNLFWFIELVRKGEKIFFLSFIKNLKKLSSPYITDIYKAFVMDNLNILFNQMDYLIRNGFNKTLVIYINNQIVIESINANLEFLTQMFTDCICFTFRNKFNQNICLPKDKLFIIEKFDLLQDIIGKYSTVYVGNIKNSNLLVYSIFKIHNVISESLSTIDSSVLESIRIVNSQFLDHSSVKMINYVLSYIRFIQMLIAVILLHKKRIFDELFKDFTNDFINSLKIVVLFVNKVEGLLEKEKRIWMKDNETKYNFNNSTIDVIKIKTMILFYLNNIPNGNTVCIIDEIFSNKHIKDIENYNERLLEFLEKSNDNEVFYVLKIINIYMYYNSSSISENFLKSFIKIGFKTISEKRENLNYLNTFTFLESFINPKVIKELKFSALPIIQKTFSTVTDLNQKRSWLILKVSTDLIINVFNHIPEIICELGEVILNLAESKETRGEDSYMIDITPEFLYMPFNMNPTDIQKNSFASEDVSKYGLYCRIIIIEFFDRNVKQINSGIYLHLIEMTLGVIDKNSSMKSEMLFTEKHRKKLRLSQFLLILSKVFLNLNSYDNKDQIERIELLTKSIFQKVNLNSVRYYFELFCINFSMIKPSLVKFFLNTLADPNAKTHCVTSSLTIIAIILLEKNYPFDTQIYNIILSLCTSNICNIRGLAQYFVYKFRDLYGLQTNKDINILPKCFYEYLINNTQILKFFKRFDETYQKYLTLIHEFDVVVLLKSNFDELNCEIIPVDLLKEFKEVAVEMVPIENTDSSKANYSWRLEIEDEKENYDESIEISSDFQKKYRPEEIESNLAISCSIKTKKRRRLDVIVMASLIDKAPNLGGLARTCEVFNIGSMTISSESYLNDNSFLTAAASAERWLPMISLPVCDIEKYVKTYRKLGYTIIGLEQTANSVSLKEYEFKEKCVIVLGNEKEGIPQNLIHLLDVCVIIPQFGEIRSLNVHVSAALMLWEYVNCCMKIK